MFKMLFRQVENFQNKSTFYSSSGEFFPIIEKLNIINTRKRAKKMSAYNFSILHITIPHNLLIKVLLEIIHFVLNRKFVVKLDFQQLLYIGLPKT